MDFSYQGLDEDDQKLFQKYSKGINKAVREAFPSIPANFELKPVTIRKVSACAILYDLMIGLPDGTFAKVSFSEGGLQVQPPPGTQLPEKTFRVESTPCSSAYE